MALSHDPAWPRASDWPPLREHAAAAVLGIPTWRTSLSPTTAHTTPTAVRAALRRYSPYAYGIGEVDGSVVDAGDIPDPDGDPAVAAAAVAQVAARVGLLIALGGDNAATVPAARGTWGEQITTAGLVTLDAHHDLRDGVSNGSPVRQLIEAGLAGSRVVQVGIADFANSAAYAARAHDLQITVIGRAELDREPMAAAMERALSIAGAAGGPIHVDLDVDVCDRAVAPACPASLPGGISAHELRTAARLAGAHPQVSSIDLTEVDAAVDTPDQRTVRLVALCVLEALTGLASRATRGGAQ